MKSDLLPRPAGQIVLRRLQVSDLAAFQAYRCDPEVARYQGWQVMTDVEAEGFLAAVAADALLQPGQWCQIAIAERRGDFLIGDIGICLAADSREAEIGFSLSREKQGKGLAREAVREAIRLILDQTPVQRVVGITDARNLPSIRLLERLGMQKTEELETVFQDEPCTEFVYAIERGAALNLK